MNKKKLKKYPSFFEHSAKVMPRESVERADRQAKEIISFLKLAEARHRMGLRQTDIKGFSQADISKIENRTDIKLSTLIEYMRSIGLGIKIVGIPSDKKQDEFLILKAE